jgi:hypothetical protein
MNYYCFFLIAITYAVSVNSQILKTDSVRVDSLWNSDSSWYDNNGLLQNRVSRDCIVSFIPSSQGTVSCSLSVSIDSGKTWDKSPNPLRIIDTSYNLGGLSIDLPRQSKPFPAGVRKKIIARMFSGDQEGVSFRVICRQYAPTLTGTPSKYYCLGQVGDTSRISFHVSPVSNSPISQGNIIKYYWDTTGSGNFNDSTDNGIYSWKTSIPDYSSVDSIVHNVSVRARDINNLISPIAFLNVVFCFDTNLLSSAAFLTIGSSENMIASSIDFDSAHVLVAAFATQTGSGIDLVGSYFNNTSSFRIFNPVYARDSSNIGVFANWHDPAATTAAVCKRESGDPESELVRGSHV